MLAEYRESSTKYVYLDDKRVASAKQARSKQQKLDEPQDEDFYEAWRQEQLKQNKLDIVNLRKQAKHFLKLGSDLFNARQELDEKLPAISQTNLTDPSKIPKEFMNDLYQAQAIQTSAFLESVSETMEPDLWKALKAKVKNKVESAEVVSTLKSLGKSELLYFTFGAERKSKGV